MDEKKKKYLMFYDVNDVQGNSVVGTHPMELSYSDNPIKVLLDKNVPIHKVYCLSNDSKLPDMDMFADDFNHEELFVADWWCYTFESTEDEVLSWWWCEGDKEDIDSLNKEFPVGFKDYTICRGDYESMPDPMKTDGFDDEKMTELAKCIGVELKKWNFDEESEYYEDEVEGAFWREMEECAVAMGMTYYEDEE